MKKLENIEEVLIVIDVINGFLNEGNMKDGYINRIVPGIEVLVKSVVEEQNKEVIYIKDSHTKDSLEFKKFPVHCLENSNESEMVDELKKYEDKIRVYKKNSTSAVFAKGLLEDINSMINLKKIIVVGCCSDICVLTTIIPLANYFDENNRDIKVEVRGDLIETYDSVNHRREEYNDLAKKLFNLLGIKITGEEK